MATEAFKLSTVELITYVSLEKGIFLSDLPDWDYVQRRSSCARGHRRRRVAPPSDRRPCLGSSSVNLAQHLDNSSSCTVRHCFQFMQTSSVFTLSLMLLPYDASSALPSSFLGEMEPSPAFHPSDRGLLARSHLQVESVSHAGTPPPLTDPLQPPLLAVVALAAVIVVVV